MHYFDNEAAWEAFRAEAESWLGTPYRHLQRCKGRGADCTLFVGQALLDAGLLTHLEYTLVEINIFLIFFVALKHFLRSVDFTLKHFYIR